MYAIICSGGKQYKVQTNDVLKVELLTDAVGAEVKLPVIFVSNNGEVLAGDAVKKASVSATVVSHGRGKKLDIFTYKAKKNIRKRQGHRQPYTELKVNKISI
jgi:large subunit ribosomal protein L21